MLFAKPGANALRLVADTNIVVSARLWKGTPHVLFQAANDHPLEFFTSAILLDELAEVLLRRKLAKAIRATGLTAAALLEDYREFASLVIPKRTRRVVLADPDDDHVLACALAAQADLIVSGDRHLLDLKGYRGIPIVSAAEALRRIERREPRP